MAKIPAAPVSSRYFDAIVDEQMRREAKPAASAIPPTRAEIALGPLSDADGNELEMGCMGAFSVGKRNLLMVSGGLLVFRPEGTRVLAPVSNAQFESFQQDDAVYTYDGYRLTLRARGPSEPGFDGHRVNAVLTISKGTNATSFKGKWGFGC
jgi:hypothetical protein